MNEEKMRASFEADAAAYGFDLKRLESAAPEPWSEYQEMETGMRWGGFIAGYEAALQQESEAVAVGYVHPKAREWLNEGSLVHIYPEKIVSNDCPVFLAPPAAQAIEAVAVREWVDALVENIDAIDCRYRGDPTYDHDAYYMKDLVKKLIADQIKYLPASTTTPPSAQAIEAAVYMRAAEVLEDRAKEWDKITTGTLASSYAGELRFMRKAILALIPQDGRTALEEFGVDLLRRTLKQLDSCVTYPSSVNELRAIVNQAMKEVAK